MVIFSNYRQRGKITDGLIQRLRTHKPTILAELKREKRHEKVLRMLANRPDSHQAFITETSNQISC